MKKILLILIVLVIGIASCKKKSDYPEPIIDPEEPGVEVPPASEANTLPMKMSINANGKSEVYTITYQSGTKKIAKIEKSNGPLETYQYAGDLIERINYGSAGNDYTMFEYSEKGALIRKTHYQSSNLATKIEYSYPSESKVTFVESEYKNNNWETRETTTLEIDSKGNFIKGSSNKELQVTLSYDNKNSPFLNVTGWSKIHYTGGVPLGDNIDVKDVVGRRNNPVKTKVTGRVALNLAFSYEFGDSNNLKFPTKIIGEEGDKTSFSLEICYSGDCSITDNSNHPGNGEQPNPETATLPETIVMTSNGETRAYTISYQENSAKLDKITVTNGRTIGYEYKGDLIEKEYTVDRPDEYDWYEYSASNQLMKVSSYRGNNNAHETILSYSGTKLTVTGDEIGEDGNKLELNYDGRGNLTVLEIFDKTNVSAAKVSVTYDDKNTAFKNVLGWRQIRFLVGVPLGDNIGYEDIMAVVNNPLKVTGSLGENVEVVYIYEFKDNKNPKFPTSITGTVKVAGAVTNTFTAAITYKQ